MEPQLKPLPYSVAGCHDRAVGEGWSGKGWKMRMARSQLESLDLPETAPSSAAHPGVTLPGATAEAVGMSPSCPLKPLAESAGSYRHHTVQVCKAD